jgi:hypothetical protein
MMDFDQLMFHLYKVEEYTVVIWFHTSISKIDPLTITGDDCQQRATIFPLVRNPNISIHHPWPLIWEERCTNGASCTTFGWTHNATE